MSSKEKQIFFWYHGTRTLSRRPTTAYLGQAPDIPALSAAEMNFDDIDDFEVFYQ